MTRVMIYILYIRTGFVIGSTLLQPTAFEKAVPWFGKSNSLEYNSHRQH